MLDCGHFLWVKNSKFVGFDIDGTGKFVVNPVSCGKGGAPMNLFL